LVRVYVTDDGWLCVAAPFDVEWAALQEALSEVTELADPRFATAAGRRANADELAKVLTVAFASRPAAAWFDVLDGHGVPCEVANREFFRSTVYDDPSFRDAAMVGVTEHPRWGRVEQHGQFFSFSRTPLALERAPVVPGFHSREILGALGYTDAQIDDLAAKKVALVVDR
jgi:crotonobetainyl-CoA:carnitine CoA-transferase CaiB-like acyl-CoA transferase